MPASYPNSAKSFTTKNAGQTIDPNHINDLQLEVAAIENDLITGLPIARGGTGATSFAANRIAHVNAGNTALTSTSGFTFDGTILATLGQIAFPSTQNPSTNVNTLDDYEEGSWTPSIGGSGGQSGQAYTLQVGKYVKVGKMVTAYFHIQLSTLGTVTTSAQVQGLPFTTENTTNLRPPVVVGYWTNFSSNNVFVGGFAGPNGTVIDLYVLAAAGTGLASMVQADLANTSILIGSITYAATA